jgi:2'-5' RNA ligase
MTDSTRIFFALWPADTVRHAIVSQAKPLLQGLKKTVSTTKLHLTLAFIGNIETARLDDYRQAAETVRAQAFELTLDQAGSFSRAQVLWLGCSRVPAELQILVDRLNAALQQCGYTPDHRPYVPHLTLARKYRKKPRQDISVNISWPVNDFCLVESRPVQGGVEYHVLQSWPLLGESSK